MKNSMALFTIFLVAAVLLSQAQAQFGPSRCCFEYQNLPIPLKRLKSYEYSNARCSLPAVIFTTKKNKSFCADPSQSWVKEAVRLLTKN